MTAPGRILAIVFQQYWDLSTVFVPRILHQGIHSDRAKLKVTFEGTNEGTFEGTFVRSRYIKTKVNVFILDIKCHLRVL